MRQALPRSTGLQAPTSSTTTPSGRGVHGLLPALAGRAPARRADAEPTRHGEPTFRDYEKQSKLRRECVSWLLKPEQLPFCEVEGGILVRQQLGGGQVVPFERDDSSIKQHLQGRMSAHRPLGVYARDALLRAMAAVKQVHLVSIDTSQLEDACTVYVPGTSTKICLKLSWAEELVPKLLRQQRGEVLHREASYKVILWNGDRGPAGHFDATAEHAAEPE